MLQKYTIDHNFNQVKRGQTICYHIGNLGADRSEFQYKMVKNTSGNLVKEYTDLTNEAKIIDTIANITYSKCFIRECEDAGIAAGTCEFELKQQKLGFNKYAYLAKRIK